MKVVEVSKKICVALDFSSNEDALQIVRELRGLVSWFKVGSQLFLASGPRLVQDLANMGLKVFLDLKFHDIPNTVDNASREATKMGVSMFNVHASGGTEMMRVAVEAAAEVSQRSGMPRPKVLAVTVLTSLDEASYQQTSGAPGSVSDHVQRLADLAKQSNLDGVVASPLEISIIRKKCGTDFLIVTPGIRGITDESGDQRRIMSPSQAVASGASLLVIGRPITAAASPKEAVEAIFQNLLDK